MKLPRDLSGEQFIAALKAFGYQRSRQIGSHVRLTSQLRGEHHLSVPLHKPIKAGTLSGILTDVAEHFEISKSEVLKRLFG